MHLNIFFISVFCLQARTGRVSRDKIADLLSEPGLNYFQQLGEFFILYLVAKNMDEVKTIIFLFWRRYNLIFLQVGMKELVTELHSALRPAYSNAPTLKASSKNNSAVE
mgnify:FL=1